MKALSALLLVGTPALLACHTPRTPTPLPDAIPAGMLPVPTPTAVLAESTDSATQAEFRNVRLHVAPGLVLGIRYLRGQMRSKSTDPVVVFDDKRSFIIHLAAAEVALTMDDLGHLMNDYVFGYHGAPLRDLHFATVGGALRQRGILHKVVDIPFEITAAPSVTSAGKIRLHPTAIRIFKVDGQGLMRALGIKLQRLLDLRRAKGISVEGNDLLLDPDSLLPPPTIEGRLTAVRVQGGEIVQVFGDSGALASLPAFHPPDAAARNYMYFRGGTLRFGKLFMVHADMQLIDADPADPFDFSLDEYNRQLVAGYSKNTPQLGLRVYMPDLGKLKVAAGPLPN
jgi:hypothetical protein